MLQLLPTCYLRHTRKKKLHNVSFFSIDDFYDDPDEVRNIALSAEYNPKGVDALMNVIGSGTWPGITSVDVYKYPKIDGIVSRLLGTLVRQTYNSGKFRLSFDGDTGKSPLHVDSVDPNVFAGVLYLNKFCESTPGTILYTHKESKRSIADTDSFNKVVRNGDINDLSKWDADLISQVKYNRLIVYPANRYHGPGPSFGKTKEDARLVQLFLWEVI